MHLLFVTNEEMWRPTTKKVICFVAPDFLENYSNLKILLCAKVYLQIWPEDLQLAKKTFLLPSNDFAAL